MHIYFSGIGGTGVGPLALIAREAGFTISGSDKQDSTYISYLKQHGITDIHIGQDGSHLANLHAKTPVDWFVYSSALAIEQPNAPELVFCREHNIKATKRDEFLSYFLTEKKLKLIAIAGTHGKTTTTAMAIWLFKQLGIPLSYSVGAKLSFGDMGEYDKKGEYFVYEADEFDRNFLAFNPFVTLIAGLDWDHADIYPTRESYNETFIQFVGQSQHTVVWEDDASLLGNLPPGTKVLQKNDPLLDTLHLAGEVNRQDALLVASSLQPLLGKDISELIAVLNTFPGVSRRFEKISEHIYSDYAHTPPKIRGALQLAHEVAGKNVVVVYEGLHNTRQHFIREELAQLFDGVKKLYIVPSYLAREDPNLSLLSPEDIKNDLSKVSRDHAEASVLGDNLAAKIREHVAAGDLVLCITAGGGNSLDEWLRKTFANK